MSLSDIYRIFDLAILKLGQEVGKNPPKSRTKIHPLSGISCLDDLQFRWFNIKGMEAGFPFLVMPISNHHNFIFLNSCPKI